MTTTSTTRSRPGPPRRGEPRGRPRGRDESVPARAPRRRPGDRRRARPRAHDDLPLVRVARGADRRRAGARHRAAARRGARSARAGAAAAQARSAPSTASTAASPKLPPSAVSWNRSAEAAVRIITSGAGRVQPRNVARITEADRGRGPGRDLCPAGRAGDARVRDRAARRGVHLQRDAAGCATVSTACARSRPRCWA